VRDHKSGYPKAQQIVILWSDTKLRMRPPSVHTPTMTLKGAALLAFIETALITVFLTWTFVLKVLNVLHGTEAPVVLFSSFIYAFGCFTVALFLFVFHRAQM